MIITPELKSLESMTTNLSNELNEMVALFKERSAIMSIRTESLQDTFDEIRTEIRRGV